jgi:hypothetical protein
MRRPLSGKRAARNKTCFNDLRAARSEFAEDRTALLQEKREDPMSQALDSKAGRAIAAMSLTFFGTVWLVAGCLITFETAAGPLAAAGAGCCLFVFALIVFLRSRDAGARHTQHDGRRAMWRRFHVVNAAQWVGIGIAGGALGSLGYSEWTVPVVICIVGLHFLPLATILATRWYYITGAALILLAITYPLLPAGGPSSPIGPFGAGVILWASAMGALHPGWRPPG